MMIRSSRLMVSGAAWLGVWAAVPAFAADPAPVYSISQLTLSAALLQLAQAANRNILFNPDQLRGKPARTITATTVEEALHQLLEKSGFTYEIDADGLITIVPQTGPVGPAHPVPSVGHERTPSSPDSEVVINGHRFVDSGVEREIASSQVVNVLSSDEIARNSDNNIAETLARLPGVAILPSTAGGSIGGGVADDAARGEGGYVSVRGLGPDYTVNLINGVNVAQGKPYSRQVELSLLPPFGYSRVDMFKTSLPEQDGDAIGGTVDFRDASAFDIGKALTRLSLRGIFSDNDASYHLPNGDGAAQVEFSRLLAQDTVGVHAVAYYARHNFANKEFQEGQGSWDFLETTGASDHTPVTNLSPTSNLVGEQPNAQLSYGTTTRYGGNLSLDWHGGDTSLFFRTTYAHSATDQYIVQRSVQATNQDNLCEVTGQINAASCPGNYRTIEDGIVGSYWFETNPELADLLTSQLGGHTVRGPWTTDYDAFYAWGRDDRPDHVELAYKNNNLDPTGTVPLNVQLVGGNPAFPVPVLTAAQLAEVNNLADYLPQSGSGGLGHTQIANQQRRTGGKFDMRLDVDDNALQFIKAGAKFVYSRRDSAEHDYEYDPTTLSGMPASLAGNAFVTQTLSSPIPGGNYPYITPLMSASRLLSYVHTLPLSAASGVNGLWLNPANPAASFAQNENQDSQRGSEAVAAAYSEADFRFGALEVIPGLRFEHTDIENTYWLGEFDTDGNPSGGSFQSSHTHYDEPLPSVHVNYRPNETTVYRAAYWSSYTRPALFLLGGGTTRSDNSDGSFTVVQGNPNLKSVDAQNFDLSGAWDSGRGAHVLASVFYKHLLDYLFDAGSSTTGSHSGSTFTTTNLISQPMNGGSARAYGLELAASQKLDFLPQPFVGFALSGNLTWQHTSSDLNLPGVANGGPMQYAPTVMLNTSLSYIRENLHGALTYRYTGSYLESYYTYTNSNGVAAYDLGWWDHPTQRLDLSVGYSVSQNLEIGVAVQNLLDDYSYYSTRGLHSPIIPEIVEPGRQYFLSISCQL